MHPYTVALIVLASIALFIVLALVVFAFLTNTFCFARGEPREERGGRAQVDNGGKVFDWLQSSNSCLPLQIKISEKHKSGHFLCGGTGLPS